MRLLDSPDDDLLGRLPSTAASGLQPGESGSQMQRLIPIFLRIIGVVLIIVGIIAAYYGPLEIFVFYLFSEGGRFHYDGFGVGPFWFAALVVQNIGYYIIAALFLPVGIGHVHSAAGH